jgi:hypothetical protein
MSISVRLIDWFGPFVIFIEFPPYPHFVELPVGRPPEHTGVIALSGPPSGEQSFSILLFRIFCKV